MLCLVLLAQQLPAPPRVTESLQDPRQCDQKAKVEQKEYCLLTAREQELLEWRFLCPRLLAIPPPEPRNLRQWVTRRQSLFCFLPDSSYSFPGVPQGSKLWYWAIPFQLEKEDSLRPFNLLHKGLLHVSASFTLCGYTKRLWMADFPTQRLILSAPFRGMSSPNKWKEVAKMTISSYRLPSDHWAFIPARWYPLHGGFWARPKPWCQFQSNFRLD